MEVITKEFNELTLGELYQILQLRSEVFVVEQDCPYQDIDGKDDQALHVIGSRDNQVIGYARCLPPGVYFDEAAIGRVVIRAAFRERNLGHILFSAAVKVVQQNFSPGSIRISAQLHLTKFYEKHQFEPVGSSYLEDGIPHINMIKKQTLKDSYSS